MKKILLNIPIICLFLVGSYMGITGNGLEALIGAGLVGLCFPALVATNTHWFQELTEDNNNEQ